jgi:hypothetical protein
VNHHRLYLPGGFPAPGGLTFAGGFPVLIGWFGFIEPGRAELVILAGLDFDPADGTFLISFFSLDSFLEGTAWLCAKERSPMIKKSRISDCRTISTSNIGFSLVV